MTRMGHPRVVCGLDPRQATEGTVDRACRVAGPRGHVTIVCLLETSGGADRGPAAALAASVLERAMRQARAAGVSSSVYMLRSPDPVAALRRAAEGGSALVLARRAPDERA